MSTETEDEATPMDDAEKAYVEKLEREVAESRGYRSDEEIAVFRASLSLQRLLGSPEWLWRIGTGYLDGHPALHVFALEEFGRVPIGVVPSTWLGYTVVVRYAGELGSHGREECP